MSKRNLFLIFTAIFFSSFAFASDYDDWLKSQNQQYNNYKKTIDEEFSSMLKKDWEAFELMKNPTPYKKPKPIKLPTIKKIVNLPKKEIIKSPKITSKPIPKKKIKVIKKITQVRPKENFSLAKFKFYNNNITIQYDKNIKFNLRKIDQISISNYWEILSKSSHQILLKQIDTISKQFSLNDWAKYQLIYKLGTTIYQDKNIANLFSWFVLSKLNYDTKVGYSENNIYLLSTIKHKVYQVAFLNIKNQKYYILTQKGRLQSIKPIYTYIQNYPQANKKLSFESNKPIKLYNNIKEKKLSFSYDNQKYTINVKYSKELIEFYKTFPQSDYEVYFDSKKSPILSNTLLSSLQKVIKNKSELEAANILLRFTQTAFRYKTDPEQFKYEKVLFPEETIFYPYSDCEDRSIMFSFLVKNLLNLDVVGIKYKDHLCTAVRFNSKVKGDNFIKDGKIYTISDPTYINANIGMTMPKYVSSKFEIIQ
jgi:hypothetical protein